MEQYLRHYVEPYCRDWDAYLPYAQFAMNNSRSMSTGLTPYYLNYGRHPRTPLTAWQAAVQTGNRVPGAVAYRQRIADALAHAKQCLTKSQAAMKKAADRKRRPAPVYTVGQEVLLSTRNLAFKGFTGAHARKLLPRWVGPFKVAALVGQSAVRLNLLEDMRIHDVFHVSLVKPYQHGGTGVVPPPLLALDNSLQYEIECIVAQRGRGSTLQYLTRWAGYSGDHDTWEPASGFKNAPEIVAAWNVRRLQQDSA